MVGGAVVVGDRGRAHPERAASASRDRRARAAWCRRPRAGAGETSAARRAGTVISGCRENASCGAEHSSPVAPRAVADERARRHRGAAAAISPSGTQSSTRRRRRGRRRGRAARVRSAAAAAAESGRRATVPRRPAPTMGHRVQFPQRYRLQRPIIDAQNASRAVCRARRYRGAWPPPRSGARSSRPVWQQAQACTRCPQLAVDPHDRRLRRRATPTPT